MLDIRPWFRKAWTDALRSGNYPQGRKRLRHYNQAHEVAAYCCLAVGQESLFKITGPRAQHEISSCVSFYDLLTCSGLPETVSPYIKMNDTQELSFNRIADWIEAQPLESMQRGTS